ncbi:MAG: hypothetical protein GF411_00525 [Candidatus Lokiarchaeota archaeon]|nr:hypothetical protein [Candidatus Lokiarchaeota archaeon]
MGEDERNTEELRDEDNPESSFRYSVKHITQSSWIIYLLITVVMSIGYLFIIIDSFDQLILPEESAFSFLIEEQLLGLIIPNLIIILITPLVWQKTASIIMQNQVVRSFESAKKKSIATRPMSLLGRVFGMKTFGSEHNYYLEGKVEERDLNDITNLFRNRMLSAISSNIGFTFYIAFLINYFLPSDLTGKDALFLSIMVMQLVPLLISWIVPVNWALKDTLIRTVGENNTIYDMGEEMNNGILDKFIGIGGLIVGVNVAFDLAYDATLLETTNILVAAVYFVFYFLLLSSGTIVIISAIYLNGYHESLVNSVRVKLSEVIRVASTNINNVEITDAVRTAVTPPSTGAGKTVGKTLIVLLALIGLALCMYYVLVVIGPFGYLFFWI